MKEGGTTMEFKERALMQIADMICGNFKEDESFFCYRSTSYLNEFFFQDCAMCTKLQARRRRHIRRWRN
jgi:hypothetical protein